MEAQHARTNLRRLLRRCEGPRSAVHGPEQRMRLASFVDVLERLWHQLEESSECSEDELAEYWRRIEGVAELLDDAKLLSGSTGALANSRAHANARITRAQANAELAGRATVACAQPAPPTPCPSALAHRAARAQRGCTRRCAVSL